MLANDLERSDLLLLPLMPAWYRPLSRADHGVSPDCAKNRESRGEDGIATGNGCRFEVGVLAD